MCYKIVNDKTGKIINQSVICSATEPGTVNLNVDPIEPLSPNPDDILDEMMSTADFEAPLSRVDPVDSIPASMKSRTWQEKKRIMKSIKKSYNNDIFTPLNPSLRPTGNINIQHVPRPRQIKRQGLQKKKNSSFSETKGRRSHLCLYSLNLFFEMSQGSRAQTIEEKKQL